MEKPSKIAPAKGKLGILLPGMGAVSTTFMAGVELVRKGKSQPVGSLTQMGTIRLGKRTDGRSPLIHKFVPLAELKDLTFGERPSVRLPRRIVPICVSEPTGCDLPLRTSSTPAINVVLTAPMPGSKIPSFPLAGAIFDGFSMPLL